MEMVKKMRFYTRGAEWLSETDMSMAVMLSRHFEHVAVEGNPPQILEVGVWKGAWSANILMNTPNCSLVGIDPYPGITKTVRDDLLNRLDKKKVLDRFRLVESWSKLGDGLFSIIHIDGEHSFDAASRDLHEAKARLIDGGIVVMDDFRHRWYPGVTEALFRFLREKSFLVLADTGAKAYICHETHHEILRGHLISMLDNNKKLVRANYFREGDNPPYIELPDVGGHPVVMVSKKGNRYVNGLKELFRTKFLS